MKSTYEAYLAAIVAVTEINKIEQSITSNLITTRKLTNACIERGTANKDDLKAINALLDEMFFELVGEVKR